MKTYVITAQEVVKTTYLVNAGSFEAAVDAFEQRKGLDVEEQKILRSDLEFIEDENGTGYHSTRFE